MIINKTVFRVWYITRHAVSNVRTRHLIYYSDLKRTLNLNSSVCTHTTLWQAAFHGATLLWTDRMSCKKVGNLATICSGSQFSSSSIRSHSLQRRWISVWTKQKDYTYLQMTDNNNELYKREKQHSKSILRIAKKIVIKVNKKNSN